jgi:hypothetical protein
MGGRFLEAAKFSLYVSIPIGVALFFYSPDNLNRVLNRVCIVESVVFYMFCQYKFVVYPPEGPKPLTIEELQAKIKKEQEEQQKKK